MVGLVTQVRPSSEENFEKSTCLTGKAPVLLNISLSKAECKAFATAKGASYADTDMWAGGGSARNKALAKKMAPGCLFWTDSGGKTVRYNSVGQGLRGAALRLPLREACVNTK